MTATTTPAPFTTPLAPGTKVAAIGTFWKAEVVTSEVGTSKFSKKPMRKSVIRWTEDVPAAGIRKGETTVWVHVQGRTPAYIVTADN
ncbi:hypothetical protein AB0A05_07375 [Streptomyces sp. NPDC046374]|uniref:hypothetical protein n=1 Tax=Streptomyces sp. NPDC046374 TaxID=3154917 RepID=UPI0034099CD1